ncbi:MAG: putative polysaccharide biosynthesis protein [bacterium]
MKKQSFLSGAFVLAAVGVITKFFGALYRIPLTWLIGDEGMGLYGMSYPLYNMLLVLSTAGIPVAISKLVSEKVTQGDYQEAYRVFHVALLILASTGLLFSGMLLLGAKPLVERGFLQDRRAYYAVISIAPAIFFVSVMSAFRGFFQGMQTMVPTAMSQLVEQLVRAATALLLAYYLFGWGIEYAAAGAAFGAATGALAGLFLLLIYYRKGAYYVGPRLYQGGQSSNGEIIRRIVNLAIPVSLASLVMPIMQNIDVVIVPIRLGVAGYTTSEATALFGQLSQMAATLINLPTIITVALAVSLVPAISEAFTLGDLSLVRARVKASVRITIMLQLPAFVGLYLLADEIMALLYGHPEAGVALSGLSAGVLFLGLHQATSGTLQGLGRTDVPVKNLLVGAVFKVLLTYYLTAFPAFGIKGAALGTVTCFIISASLNLLAIGRLVGFALDIKEMFLKPAVAVLGMTFAVVQSHGLFLSLSGRSSMATLGAIAIGVVAYCILILLVGGLRAQDFELIPWVGSKIAANLKRFGLLRS